jgi:hypothetical protein
MTRITLAAILAVFFIVTARAAAAQASGPATLSAGQAGPSFVAAGKNPFKEIFVSRVPSVSAPVVLQTPTVMCGITVFDGDPKVDAGILVAPRRERQVAPKMRIIEPKICRD